MCRHDICNRACLPSRDCSKRNSYVDSGTKRLGEFILTIVGGRVVTMQQWAITWGIFIQYFVQYGASKVDGGPDNQNQGSAAFRIPWGIQIIPAAILFAGMFFFPKTPRWLASKDRWEEAIKVLGNLHGNGDINHPKVLAEYQEIEETLRGEREQANSGYTILTRPRIARRVILGMSIQMWSQLSGMNVMWVSCTVRI